MRKNKYFWIFLRKYEKMSKKGKMMKMGQILMKTVKINEKWKKNNYFWIFSEKYGKMSKKVKNDENGSDIDENSQNQWQMKRIIFFGFFQKNMEQCRKRWKMMKMGEILMVKVTIAGKWKR